MDAGQPRRHPGAISRSCATRSRRGRRSRPRSQTRRPSCGSPATCTAARKAAPTPRCMRCTSWPPGPTASSRASSTTPSSSSCRRRTPTAATIGQRRNLYGFDMNRDWFARTQPETDGKLDVIRQYPPMLFLDVHEFGLADYFFPPNADPIYHEIPDRRTTGSTGCTARRSSTSSRRKASSSSTARRTTSSRSSSGTPSRRPVIHAAGMTFEKESGDPIAVREHEHFTATWASIAAGAAARDAVVPAWRASFVEAYEQGLAGTLEAERRLRAEAQAPPAGAGRHGPRLLPRERPRQGRTSSHLLVRRLQRMDVNVYQLTAGLHLDAFHRYGDPPAATDLPAGTYWIPMAQGQKHWIQAMLNEETWIPFDVTFDVTAWSNPLLMDLEGGWSGESVEPAASVVPPGRPAGLGWRRWHAVRRAVRDPDQHARLRGRVPDEVPLHRGLAPAVRGRHGRRDRRGPPQRPGNPIDVLVMPDGFANYGLQALGAKGKRALRDWVNAGGTIVAWQGGAVVAAKAGASSAKFGGLPHERARDPHPGRRRRRRARSPRTSATRRGSCTRTT